MNTMKTKEDIITILKKHNVTMSNDEMQKIPELGIIPSKQIHLDAIRY